MAPDVRRAYDEATVILLRATSSSAALMVADHDERRGIPAYDDSPAVAGRDELRVCPAPGCGQRFWTRPHVTGQRFCSSACRVRWRYHTNPAARAYRRAYDARRATDRREKAA